MIPVRIVYTDSLTGEEDTFDTKVEEITGENIANALTARDGGGTFVPKALVMDRWKSTHAFILENTDEGAYGGFLVTGIIYTVFA